MGTATALRPASPPPEAPRLADAEFQQVRALIHRHAGIRLSPDKQAMVYGRLSRRLRETGHDSFARYLQALERGTGAAAARELQAFVNSLTTNLTSFFREEHHFPVLAARLRALAARPSPVRVWCCAASTGEEPYSLAMTAIETLAPPSDVRIVATDIDTDVLAHAAAGIYPVGAGSLDDGRRRRHFLRGTGRNEGSMRVGPELRRRVEFAFLNLTAPDGWAVEGPFDVVFCRNVLIYFDAPTQRRVFERLHGLMPRGALLFVGHSETAGDARSLFQPCGQTVYARV